MSNTGQCHEYAELLDAYFDDELDGCQCALLEKHLAQCSACAAQLKEIVALVTRIKSLPQLKSSSRIDYSFLGCESGPPACVHIISLLDAYYDRELASSDITCVLEHLACCAACTERLADIEKVALSLRELPRLELPYDMAGALEFKAVPAFPETDCAEILELLDAYYDGELTFEERLPVDNHLAVCPVCAGRLADIKVLVNGLKLLPRLAPDTDIVGKIDFAGLWVPERQQPAGSNVISASGTAIAKILPYRRSISLGLGTAAAVAGLVLAVSSLNLKLPGGNSPSQLTANSLKPVVTGTLNNKEANGPAFNPEIARILPVATIASGKAGGANNDLTERLPVTNISRADNQSKQLLEPKNKRAGKNQAVEPQSDSRLLADKLTSADSAAMPVRHESLRVESESSSDTVADVTAIADSSVAPGADALGIGTDEDGLYDIKI